MYFKTGRNNVFIINRISLKIQIFELMEKKTVNHQFVKRQHQLKQIWVDFSIGF